jgi:hypothetical protein
VLVFNQESDRGDRTLADRMKEVEKAGFIAGFTMQ